MSEKPYHLLPSRTQRQLYKALFRIRLAGYRHMHRAEARASDGLSDQERLALIGVVPDGAHVRSSNHTRRGQPRSGCIGDDRNRAKRLTRASDRAPAPCPWGWRGTSSQKPIRHLRWFSDRNVRDILGARVQAGREERSPQRLRAA